MDSTLLSSILIVANLVIILAGMIGGYMVLRSSVARDAQVIQDRVRNALKDENEVLQGRLTRMEEDNALLKQQIILIIEILRRQGIILEVNGEIVQIKDAKGSTFTTTHRPMPKRGAKTPPEEA